MNVEAKLIKILDVTIGVSEPCEKPCSKSNKT